MASHSHDFLGASHDRNARRTRWVVALSAAMMVAEIVGGTVFGAGLTPDKKEHVWALDAATGKPKWSTPFAPGAPDSGVGAGPRSTPTVSGGVVYALGTAGRLAALDAATGKLLWDEQLQRMFGYDPSTFTESLDAFTARVHPDDEQWHADALQAAVDTVGEYDVEYRIVLPDGVVVRVDGRIGTAALRRVLAALRG